MVQYMKFSLGTVLDIKQILKELGTGLSRLSFNENFESFSTEVVIAANTEAKIRNELGAIPQFVLIDPKGGGPVARGDGVWTTDYVYIKNYDASNAVTVKLKFFK